MPISVWSVSSTVLAHPELGSAQEEWLDSCIQLISGLVGQKRIAKEGSGGDAESKGQTTRKSVSEEDQRRGGRAAVGEEMRRVSTVGEESEMDQVSATGHSTGETDFQAEEHLRMTSSKESGDGVHAVQRDDLSPTSAISDSAHVSNHVAAVQVASSAVSPSYVHHSPVSLLRDQGYSGLRRVPAKFLLELDIDMDKEEEGLVTRGISADVARAAGIQESKLRVGAVNRAEKSVTVTVLPDTHGYRYGLLAQSLDVDGNASCSLPST